jgi:hypothetical protein
MAEDAPDPSTTSSDYDEMLTAWQRIKDIRGGIDVVRAKGVTYLPKYAAETQTDYERRRDSTPWRPEWVDAHRNLCSKPFEKEVTLKEGAPGPIETLTEDIDGQGNNLHVFARKTFADGIAMGLHGILVDYPAMAPGMTLADERESGARPYWVHIAADQIIDFKMVSVGGRMVTDRLRIQECVTETDPADEFSEIEIERIRYFKRNGGAPTWELWELIAAEEKEESVWVRTAEGPITLPEIPFVAYFTGERSGNYRVKPPLTDLAVMQIELYQSLSRKDEIMTYAGSPMLKATGFNPPEPERDADGNERPRAQLTVGPKTILFAPPAMDGVQPDWDFIQPDAANIKEVREDANGIIEDMRRLGLQPLTPRSGNMTATGAAIEGAKAHSAVQAWALGMKDALEQAFVFTSQWLGVEASVEVEVHTDFGIDVQGVEEAKIVGDASKRGTISKKTEREELARRGILGPNFDEKEEDKRLAEQQEGMDPEQQIDPRTGRPIVDPDDGASGAPAVAA